MEKPKLQVIERGRERYADTWEFQRALHAQRKAGEAEDSLVLVEHEHVITLGKSGDSANLLASEARLAELGIDLHRTERGGDVTYHGPGQLVAYPIISLRERGISLRDYMRGLEQILIDTASQFGIDSERVTGRTGVWTPEGKIAAIGVAVKGGVSYHGIALNVCTDLSMFSHIVPCGIADADVASLSSVSGNRILLEDAKSVFLSCFAETFGYILH